MPTPIIDVTDADDPRIADYRNVPDAELLHRRGLFVAEGRLVVRRLIEGNRLGVRSVMVTRAGLAAIEDLVASHPHLLVHLVPQAVMNGITGFNMHRGCLAIGERPAPMPWRDAVREARLVVVLERVGNADNVGSIFRSAAALGAGAVLLGPDCADPLYRKAIRTSMAAALSLPYATLASRAEAMPDALDALAAEGFVRVALTPAGRARPLREAIEPLRGRRIALLVGHEGDGLSAETLARSDVMARIPMAPGVDSLNVATATAIALSECYDSHQ